MTLHLLKLIALCDGSTVHTKQGTLHVVLQRNVLCLESHQHTPNPRLSAFMVMLTGGNFTCTHERHNL